MALSPEDIDAWVAYFDLLEEIEAESESEV